MQNKPKIIGGICEFCGIPAKECPHYSVNETPVHPILADIKPILPKMSETKIADIIIPTHNRSDLLKQTLESIPIDPFNVFIIRGKTYSQGNNIGIKMAQTDNLIFCNDDMILNYYLLEELCESPFDIAIAQQYLPDGNPLFCGLKWVNNDFMVLFDQHEVEVPTSALFRIKRSVMDKLGEFDEGFKNGGEDHDLFFRALEMGFNFGFVNTPVLHFSSQSSGRFLFEKENTQRLRERWTNERITNLLKKI